MTNESAWVGYIDIIARMDWLEASILAKMGAVWNKWWSTFAWSFKTAVSPLAWYITSILSVTAVTQFGKQIFNLASQVQQAKIAFDKLTGSEELSLKLLNDIKNLAKTTPYDQMWLVDWAKRMLAYWFKAQQVIPILNSLWNAVSAVWWNQETLNWVIIALWQMQTKGRLVQQEVNQIAERGIPIFDILREKLWLTNEQLWDIGNQGIIASQAIPLILEGINERYNWIMDQQALTLQGRWSNMMDVVKITMADIGLASADGMWWAISNITSFISDNHDKILNFITDITDTVWDMTSTIWDILWEAIVEIETVANTWASALQDMNASITGDTKQTMSGLTWDWSDWLYYIKLWLDGLLWFINIALSLIVSSIWWVFDFMMKWWDATAEVLVWVFHGVATTVWWFFDVLASKIWWAFISAINGVISGTNWLIKWLNKALPQDFKIWTIWQIENTTKKFSDIKWWWDLLNKWASDFKRVWSASFSDVWDTWNKTSNKMVTNMEDTYLKRVKSIRDQETAQFVKSEKEKIKADLDTMEAKIQNGQKLTKAEKEEYDKKKEYLGNLNRSLDGIFGDDGKDTPKDKPSWTSSTAKQVIADYKDINKAIEDSGKKLEWYQDDITDVKDKFTELKDWAIKDISDINISIDELWKKTTEKLWDRFIEVKNTIADIEVAMKRDWKSTALFDGLSLDNLESMRNSWTSEVNWFDVDKLIEYKKAQQELADITKNTTKEVRDQALAYSELNETQKILQEKQDELIILQEKKAIAEAFSSQQSLDNNALQIKQTWDSISAFYEDEAWKLVEIKDLKNIQYAQELIDKQNQLSQEMDLLKWAREIEEGQYILLQQNKILYEQNYTKALRTEINLQKSFVDELIAKYQALNSVKNNSSSGGVAGKRAYWWPVQRWKVYITWENHHNEEFIPYTNWFIAPSYDNSKHINVDVWQINSNSPQDFGDRLRQNIGNYL